MTIKNSFEKIFRKIGIILVISVLSFILIELISKIFMHYVNLEIKKEYLEHPVISKYPNGKDYLNDVYNYKWDRKFYPYYAFKEKEFKSKTININHLGIRQTIGNCQNKKSVKINIYGGSTVLGVGVADDQTIPSHLAKILNQTLKKKNADEIKKCYLVKNEGGGFWVSSQDFIRFQNSINKIDNEIDYAIFYQGINDIIAVKKGGKPGDMDPLYSYYLSFLNNNKLSVAKFLVNNSNTFSAISNLLFKIKKKSDKQNVVIINKIRNNSYISSAISEIYINNILNNSLICNRKQIKCIFILQPYPLLTKKKLSKNEKKIFNSSKSENSLTMHDSNIKLSEKVYEKIINDKRVLKLNNFYDFTEIFDLDTQELFVDTAHLLDLGNKIAANKIFNIIKKP